MIIVDIKTTGIDPLKCSIVTIGAVHFETGKQFYTECRPKDGAVIRNEALEINGFTKDYLNSLKDSDVDIYCWFVNFCTRFPKEERMLAGYNIAGFGLTFLKEVHSRTSSLLPEALSKFPFSHRTLDLHSLAFQRFKKSLTQDEICINLGLPTETRPLNALNGAISQMNCIRKLL
jgi:DNA polymerase III epsilon subunit-like protein